MRKIFIGFFSIIYIFTPTFTIAIEDVLSESAQKIGEPLEVLDAEPLPEEITPTSTDSSETLEAEVPALKETADIASDKNVNFQESNHTSDDDTTISSTILQKKETLILPITPLDAAESTIQSSFEPQSTGLNNSSPIVISEIQISSTTSSLEEFVELYNQTDESISLTGYKLTKRTKSGNESSLVTSTKFIGTIPAKGYFVIAHPNFATEINANISYSSASYSIAKDNTVILYDSNGIIRDLVGFGEATVAEGTPATNPDTNQSIIRKKIDSMLIDTDNNNADFSTNTCPSPHKDICDVSPLDPPENIIYPPLLINEVFPNPKDAEEDNEFIEIYNPTSIPVSLVNWIISDASQTGKYIIKNGTIPAHDYFTIYRSSFKFALNNTGLETISLTSPNNIIMSTIFYNYTIEGKSFNRDTPWYYANPTPNTLNTINPQNVNYPSLLITEILPNPIGDESVGEYIEIYNPHNFLVDLTDWMLCDKTMTSCYTFPQNEKIDPFHYLVIYRSVFKFALNNSNEKVLLIAPNQKTTSTASYNTTAKENVSYNFDLLKNLWRWSKILTPQKENVFNNIPEITKKNIDTVGYKNTYASFSAKAKDADHEKMKVRWDFGDGHNSYLWKTRHKYLKNGIYHGSLRIQDGSEEIIYPFTITITKYPRTKLTITKVFPNPAGKDTGTEYITIKNTDKKKVNLINWSIATGTSSKTLVNHPITKSINIKKDSSLNISKKYASITLPNTQGQIELRSPDGTVVDTLTYKSLQKSVEENASYEKNEEQWQWIIPIDQDKIKKSQDIIANAVKNEQELLQQEKEKMIAYTLIHSPQISKNNENDFLPKKFTIENIYFTFNHYSTLLILKNSKLFYKFDKTEKIYSPFPFYVSHTSINTCDNSIPLLSKKYLKNISFCL